MCVECVSAARGWVYFNMLSESVYFYLSAIPTLGSDHLHFAGVFSISSLSAMSDINIQ